MTDSETWRQTWEITDPYKTPTKIEYKFREDVLLRELKQYIDATYSGHYGANEKNLQSLEVISARGR